MNKNLVTYLYLLLGIIFTTSIYAQKKENEFTLKQAIDYALENNRNSKNADLDIEAAKKQKWETIAAGLPQINGKIEYQEYLVHPLRDAGLPPESPINFLLPERSLTPSITLSQLIFDGSYIVGVQSAKVFLDISKNAKIKTDKEIEKAVTSAYSNVLLTTESKTLMKKNIESLESNLNESKLLFKNGFIEEEDIEQLQITLNNLNNTLDNLNRMYVISMEYLKLSMGFVEDTKISITDKLQVLLDDHKITKKSNDFSVFNNIDYQIAENQVEAKKLLYKLEKAKLLPSIGGFVAGNYLGNSNEGFTFFDNDHQWFSGVLFGINIDVPIFSSFASGAKRKRAKLELQKSENTLIDTEKQIEIQHQTIISELELAKNTLKNKKENLTLAEKIETKNNIKYKEGISSSFELRQAQMQLYASQQEYLQAMVNVINKKSELNALQN